MTTPTARRSSSGRLNLGAWLTAAWTALAAPGASMCLAVLPSASEVQSSAAAAQTADDALLFTPPGFKRPGRVARASGDQIGRLEIRVREAASGRPTPCRLNVVGPDGDYYQPAANPLARYGLIGEWPKPGAWGNRRDKGPHRYLGHFFYTTGSVTVAVPPGRARIEVAKGFEFAPVAQTVEVAAGQSQAVDLSLTKTADASQFGYFSGDPHFHFPRRTEQDDETALELMAAEDLHFGALLAYNEPMGPYAGLMETLDCPQLRGLGPESVRERDGCAVISGQEYRSTTYGHLLLYLRPSLVFPGKRFDADAWPVYGEVARAGQSSGGVAFQAHGGYAQEVYADAALGTVDAVELLQFGIYRGIGLADWYDILNTGYRFPITAASDWPACRSLGDCRTFVRAPGPPSAADWLHGAAEGRSFVSSGPLLLLEVDGQGPGARLNRAGPGPHFAAVRLRVRCEVTPVTRVDLIVNGQAAQTWTVPTGRQQGAWWEGERRLELRESSWVAARAWSTTPTGQPAAEAHSNPVYVYLNGRAPYRRASLETWLARIEGQLSVHRQRAFPEKAKVLAYFEQARNTLVRIREHGGLGADDHPAYTTDYLPAAAALPDKANSTPARSPDMTLPRSAGSAGRARSPRRASPWPEVTLPRAAADRPAESLAPLLTDPPAALTDRRLGYYQCLAELAGRRNLPAELKQALTILASAPALLAAPEARIRLAFAVGRGLKRAGSGLVAQDAFGPGAAQLIDEARQSAQRVALDESLPEAERLQAVEQLACLTLERVHGPLTRLLDASSVSLQIAALRALGDYPDPLATGILLRHWGRQAPAARPEAFRAMLHFPDRTLAWLRAAQRGELSLRDADATQRQSLLRHPNPQIAALARTVFGQTKTGATQRE